MISAKRTIIKFTVYFGRSWWQITQVIHYFRIGAAAGGEIWGGGPRGNFGWNGTNGAVSGGGSVYAGSGSPGQASSSGQHHQTGNRGSRKGFSTR